MQKRLRFGLAGGVTALVSLLGVVVWPIGEPLTPITLQGNVDRGAYLARASGCIACHTDFEKGGAPLAGGLALQTPFGMLYSPNLTTDPDHGIGSWTLAEFARAVRDGVSPEGWAYYPGFPYPFYANFTDQEIADLWAAFQTVPPVAQQNKPPQMRFPFDQRWGLKLWRAAFLQPPLTDPVVGKGALWNRGRELVEGATHCAACHTDRNIAGARKTESGHLQGSVALPGGEKAPAIDPETLRKRGWDISSLAYALHSGVRPDGDVFGGSMGEVVRHGTGFLSEGDRAAIATYLMNEHEGG